jgi:hypothetical protein
MMTVHLVTPRMMKKAKRRANSALGSLRVESNLANTMYENLVIYILFLILMCVFYVVLLVFQIEVPEVRVQAHLRRPGPGYAHPGSHG